MKFLYYVIPFLGAVALAQDLNTDSCQCPLVKCPGNDPVALCKCLNSRETLCKTTCPDYVPKYRPCPVKPKPSQSIKPKPTPTRTPPSTPTPTCECEEVYCLQIYPQSCHCANDAKKRCYEKCGGVKPSLQACPAVGVVAREAESEVVKGCECDKIMCAQMWPDSCYCANAAKAACHKKCGGKKPDLEKCPAPRSLTTKTKSTAYKSTSKPSKPTPTPTKPTPTKPSKPFPTHKVCGGNRANHLLCDPGYICITDPYTPGCGPACDGLGICVKDKMCGGFPGLSCEEEGQICHDDPRDACDPKNGGADCGGLCVWPHKSLNGDE